MQVGIEVPIPESGTNPSGDLVAAVWLKDQMEALRDTYMELFLPDAPDAKYTIATLGG